MDIVGGARKVEGAGKVVVGGWAREVKAHWVHWVLPTGAPPPGHRPYGESADR